MKRINLVGTAFLFILVPSILLAQPYLLSRPGTGIAARGGTSMLATNFSIQPYHLQTDPEWKNETIGGSGQLLMNVGCTVCCVSMAFSQLGLLMDPKTLNADMKKQNGFTLTGLLKWEVASSVSGNIVVFETPDKPSYSAIDSAIQAGNPVLAKILLWESVPHWVLIVGKNADEYLVKNPLCQAKEIQQLSKLSARIYSIRIPKRTSAAIGIR